MTDRPLGGRRITQMATKNEPQARLRDRRLHNMIRLCAAAHPYYKKLFDQLGLTASDFRTVDDLQKLGMLHKETYTADPESFRLNLGGTEGLSLEETTLADVIYTSGSTSQATPFYDTVHDRLARIEHIRRGAGIAGVSESDIVANLFPLGAVPHQGFLSATWGAQAIGAKLISTLTGRGYNDFDVRRSLDNAVRLVERHRATIIWGITTFVRRFVVRAQELGCDLGSVRMAMVMGEPCPPGMREDIRSRLESLGSSNPGISNGYGFTEMQAPAMECVELGPRHIAAPEQFHFETVDIESGKPAADGTPDLLLMSHLNRRGTVLLRYRVGDVVAIENGECGHCGRTGPRFTSDPYRADGLVKVKGTLVDPQALHGSLSPLLSVDGVSDYQLRIGRAVESDRYSGDRLAVRIACSPEARETAAERVRSLASLAIEVTPEVEFLSRDGFEETSQDYKFRRFVDER